jgi:hypothetical protein
MNDINWNINLKIILQKDIKKDINEKKINQKRRIIAWMLWLILLNPWFKSWLNPVKYFFILNLYPPTHTYILKKNKRGQKNQSRYVGPWTWTCGWAFKPRPVCLDLFLFIFWYFKGTYDLILKKYTNNTLPAKTNNVSFVSLDFGYHCGGWKSGHQLFFSKISNFQAI